MFMFCSKFSTTTRTEHVLALYNQNKFLSASIILVLPSITVLIWKCQPFYWVVYMLCPICQSSQWLYDKTHISSYYWIDFWLSWWHMHLWYMFYLLIMEMAEVIFYISHIYTIFLVNLGIYVNIDSGKNMSLFVHFMYICVMGLFKILISCWSTGEMFCSSFLLSVPCIFQEIILVYFQNITRLKHPKSKLFSGICHGCHNVLLLLLWII